MLARDVIVEDRTDQLASRHFALGRIKEVDDFAVSVALHALADHPSIGTLSAANRVVVP
jgi:hypothetical protein